MNAAELEQRINQTKAAMDRLEDRIRWLIKKVDYRRRRLRELGKKRAEELNMKLDL
jgi:uncharacterized coiled-coil protein SlyX